MKIENIQLTVDEMKEAVRRWLAENGLRVNVKSVDSRGYPVEGFDVECGPNEFAKVEMPEVKPITMPLAPAPL